MLGNSSRGSAPTLEPSWSPVVELRQYTLRPRRRSAFIELFDSTFVETQEEAGMAVIGQFRDLDDPDRFVWLRGFPGMAERATSLERFYDGPVWKSNREVANSTMLDSDDVLLLRPARYDTGFRYGDRAPLGVDRDVDRGVIEATVLTLAAPADSGVVDAFEHDVAPDLAEMGFSTLGYLVTESSPNSFPRIPVREGVHAFVWFGGFADRATYEMGIRNRSHMSEAAGRIAGAQRPPQTLRLEPTSRSSLTGSSRACVAASTRIGTRSKGTSPP
jgi:NIPSNAP